MFNCDPARLPARLRQRPALRVAYAMQGAPDRSHPAATQPPNCSMGAAVAFGSVLVLACLPVPATMLPTLAIALLAGLIVSSRWMQATKHLFPVAAMAALGIVSLRLWLDGHAATAATVCLVALPAMLFRLRPTVEATTIVQPPALPVEPPPERRADRTKAPGDAAGAAPEQSAASPVASHETARFLAAVSHDLRQPIHAVGLLTVAIQQHSLAPETARLVGRLDRALRGVDDLFHRLLELGRLSAGTVSAESRVFAIRPLLQALQERCAPLAEQRGLQVRIRACRTIAVCSDPALVVEILMNLVSNAIRYTNCGGVLVTARRRGARVVLQVWDTGIGIEPTEIDRIFDEYVQLGVRTHDRRGGVGLGLSIVRHLAGVLGTSVAVRSRPGRGSMFEFGLPASSDAPACVVERPDADDLLRGLLVLVVDDNTDILVATEAALSAWGCFVLLARDEHGALAAIERSERFPDVLVTDYWLKAQPSGPQVAKSVRATLGVDVPVILTTGDTSDQIKQEARQYGWTLVGKPAGPQRLREALVNAVSGDPAWPAAGRSASQLRQPHAELGHCNQRLSA